MRRKQWTSQRHWRQAQQRKRQKPKPQLPQWALAAIAFLVAVGLGQAYYQGWFGSMAAPIGIMGQPGEGQRVNFSFCHVGAGYNCVVDGDTIWLSGEKIRIADIDAPETHDYKCPEEKALGDRATTRLTELLESGSISLGSIDRDEDQYGRKLRIVMVDGESVGDTLVSEGLVRWYEGGRRPWC